MFWSKNDFFYQPFAVLLKLKEELRELLKLKGRSVADTLLYIQAYEFFTVRPDKYDGATIVKDLVDIRNEEHYLDADAMLHDFDYIIGANRSFKKKWKADTKYIKNMEKNGKGIRAFRLIVLTISSIFIVPYYAIKYLLKNTVK